MFTYVGTIASAQQTKIKGNAEVYSVSIPSLYNTDQVSAQVLALAGGNAYYEVGDVVLVMDIDGIADGDIIYLIAGLIKHYGESTQSLVDVTAEYFYLKSGNINRAVYFGTNPNLSAGYVLDTLSELKTTAGSLQSKLSAVSKSVTSLSTSTDEMVSSAAVTLLQKELSTLEDTVDKQSSRITSLSTSIDTLSLSVSDASDSLTEVVDKVTTNETDIAALKEADTAFTIDLEALTARVETLENTAETLSAQITALEERVIALENYNTTAEATDYEATSTTNSNSLIAAIEALSATSQFYTEEYGQGDRITSVYYNKPFYFFAEGYDFVCYKTPSMLTYKQDSSTSQYYVDGTEGEGLYSFYGLSPEGERTAVSMIIFDSTAPTLVLYAGEQEVASTSYVNSNYIKVLPAEDVEDLATMYYRIKSDTEEVEWKEYISKTPLFDEVTYQFYAVDKAGNESDIYEITIDLIVPVMSITDAEGISLDSEAVTTNCFTIAVSDTNFYMLFYKEANDANYASTSNTTYLVQSPGEYSFYAVDRAGNSTDVVAITANNVAEEVGVYDVEGNRLLNNSTVNSPLTVTALDSSRRVIYWRIKDDEEINNTLNNLTITTAGTYEIWVGEDVDVNLSAVMTVTTTYAEETESDDSATEEDDTTSE